MWWHLYHNFLNVLFIHVLLCLVWWIISQTWLWYKVWNCFFSKVRLFLLISKHCAWVACVTKFCKVIHCSKKNQKKRKISTCQQQQQKWIPSVFLFYFLFNYFFGLVLSEYSNNPCNSCKTSFSFIFQHKRVRGKKLSETRLGLLAKWLESSLYWGKFFRKPSSFRYYKRKLRQMDLVS